MPSHLPVDDGTPQNPTFPRHRQDLVSVGSSTNALHLTARHTHALRSTWIHRLCPKNRPSWPLRTPPRGSEGASFVGFGPFRLKEKIKRSGIDLNVKLNWEGHEQEGTVKSEAGSGGFGEGSLLGKKRRNLVGRRHPPFFDTQLADPNAASSSRILQPAGRECADVQEGNSAESGINYVAADREVNQDEDNGEHRSSGDAHHYLSYLNM